MIRLKCLEVDMTIRGRILIGVLWIGSLLAVGAVTYAQSQARELRRLPEPKVMTGGDIGFRVDGLYGDMPTGNVVIRVNGQWVEAMVGQPGVVVGR
jgi:hypothetical protein